MRGRGHICKPRGRRRVGEHVGHRGHLRKALLCAVIAAVAFGGIAGAAYRASLPAEVPAREQNVTGQRLADPERSELRGRAGGRKEREGYEQSLQAGRSQIGEQPGESEAGAIEQDERVDSYSSDVTTGTFLERLDELSEGAGGNVELSWNDGRDVPDVAADVLVAYEETESAQLMAQGFIDLKGNVWRTVSTSGETSSSTVRAVRLIPARDG